MTGDSAPVRSGPALALWAVAALAVACLVAVRLSGGASRSEGPRPSDQPDGATAATTAPAAVVPLDPADLPVSETPASPGSVAAAAAGLRFADVTKQAGLGSVPSSSGLIGDEGMTAGAAVADVNGDGWDDIYLARVGRRSALFMNDRHGGFDDVTSRAGVAGPPHGATAAAFGDIDGDGDLDLFVAAFGRGDDILYVNDGTGHFADETSVRGLVPVRDQGRRAQLTNQTHGVTFHDVNRDGAIDLLLTDWSPGEVSDRTPLSMAAIEGPTRSICTWAKQLNQPDGVQIIHPNRARLLINNGAGTFTDRTTEFGLRLDRSYSMTGQFVDVDGDGWDDLLLTSDFCTSRLYRNLDGTRFEDQTEAFGLGSEENGMGAVVRDIDGDGRPDIFVTSVGYPTKSGRCPLNDLTGCTGNRLFLNRPGSFVDVTDAYGVRNGWWGWGAAIEDFGNDGRLQIVMTNGYVEAGGDPRLTSPASQHAERFRDDPMRFWAPSGNTMIDVAEEVGLTDTGLGHALVPLDYDRDGRLDILVARTNAPPILYRNETDSTRRWLTIRLDDTTVRGERRGVGARIVVYSTDAARPTVAWITTAGSYESQKPAEAHFGLGEATSVARVEVWWPGATSAQVVGPVASNQVLLIRRSPS